MTSLRYYGRHTEYEVRMFDSDVRLLHKEDGRTHAEVGDAVQVLIDPRFLRQYAEAPKLEDES